jgi:hypothetical protein
MKYLRKILLYLLVVVAAAYLFDTVIYFLRGKPASSVQVTRLLAIPLKGGKTEYAPAGTSAVSCTLSIFPQGSANPCWYQRRNPNDVIKY